MAITLNAFDYFIIGIIAFFILVALLVIVIRRLRKLKIDEFSKNKIQDSWSEIEKLADQNSVTSWKLAVLEADKLLDYTLKSLAIPGKDLGERLRAMSYRRPEIRKVWPAHKVRNRLVHETDYQLDKKTAKWAINEFRKALKMLGIL